MARLFFDVVSPKTRQFDFIGTYFASIEEARSTAELLSIDLGCTAEDTWRGAEVQVLDPSGKRVFACPVLDMDADAA